MMAWLRVPRASVGVGVVGVLAGLIVAANAAGAGDDPERAATDLVSLARAQTGRLEDLQDENATIRSQIAPYLDAHDDDPQAADESVQAAAGSLPVSGPGIEVSLTDAPVPDGGIPADRVPDDYVVHQQDVESVINALRTGGAEALTIQGERVVSTTSIRCVGNVLYVGGRVYSPPFVVGAIGDPDVLVEALDRSEAVTIYRQWVDLIGLGFDVSMHDEMVAPASTASTSLTYADPLEPSAD
ncbi:MAG: DUF881 domain-containing protein [Actinomycetaceae bacterium]